MADLVLPLRFEPILLPKVWGGDRLSRYGKAVELGDKIGESWEIADLASTSPSGGGGGARQSVVADGPYKGRTLCDVLSELGKSFLGETRLHDDGSFPLLVKILDARENLSVQVHPGQEYVARHRGASLKAESWFVLEAEPDSTIYAGLDDGVSVRDVAEGIEAGIVPELLCEFDARPGLLVNLPSGVVHALGAGVLVVEVQTPSDTTFRVFDWGRTDRELHIEQALECIGEAPGLQRIVFDTAGGDGSKEDPYFGTYALPNYCLELIDVVPGSSVRRESDLWCAVCVIVSGSGELEGDGWREPVARGQTVLLPAYQPVELCAGAQGMKILYVLVGDTRGTILP